MTDSSAPQATEDTRLAVPQINVHTVQIASNGTDVLVTFSQIVPVVSEEGVALSPVICLSMSRGVAKELAFVVQGVSDQLDKDLGEINTPFLRERRQTEK